MIQRSTIHNLSREETRELCYDVESLIEETETNISKFQPEQRAVFEAAMNSVVNNASKIFFLDAPGGTGKTFVIRTLLAQIRKNKQIALAVASSGIAATLLPGGRTAHATFKLP